MDPPTEIRGVPWLLKYFVIRLTAAGKEINGLKEINSVSGLYVLSTSNISMYQRTYLYQFIHSSLKIEALFKENFTEICISLYFFTMCSIFHFAIFVTINMKCFLFFLAWFHFLFLFYYSTKNTYIFLSKYNIFL